MVNPLFHKDPSATVRVLLDPVELIKNPRLLMKYYSQVLPVLVDALTETDQIVERLEGLCQAIDQPQEDYHQAIELLRYCDHRLYKVLFELAHSFKEIHQKKYPTAPESPPLMAYLSTVAKWHDQFLPGVEHLLKKLPDYEGGLVTIWEVYQESYSLAKEKKFAKGRLAISMLFSKILLDALEDLISTIEESRVNLINVTRAKRH